MRIARFSGILPAVASDMLEVLGTAGHEALVKPEPLRPAVPGGYTLYDFVYAPDNGTLACPNMAVLWISPKVNVNFGAACRGCPLRDVCTNLKNGRKVVITAH